VSMYVCVCVCVCLHAFNPRIVLKSLDLCRSVCLMELPYFYLTQSAVFECVFKRLF
jgi:hypothetical protein